MRLFEGSFSAVMAAKTKRSFSLHQEFFLVRTVGEVAGGTALLPYLMNDLLFIILFLVTLKTSFIPFCFQQVAELGGMRVMVLDAFPSLQSGMDTGFIHPDLIFTVAGIADLIPLLLHQEFRNHSVPEMTALTFLFLDDGMDTLHPEVLVSKFLVAIEAILARKPSLAT